MGLLAGCPAKSPVRTASSPSAAPFAVPKGKQAIDFHGLQILVQATWSINAYNQCGVPNHDTVLVPIGAHAFVGCSPEPSAAPYTVAEFTTPESERGKQLSPIATEKTTLDGKFGRRGTGLLRIEHMRYTVLLFTDPGVVLAIHSPSDATVRDIISTAHIVTTDVIGCQSHPSSLDPPVTSKRSGARSEVIPGEPISAIGCAYEAGWIARSRVLTAGELAKLRQLMNSLPTGVSHAPPGSESEDACREDLGAGFIIHFHYRSGPDLDVFARIRGCSDLSASNGSRTVKMDANLAGLLTDIEGGGAFPGSFE
jgi:hypothetical protein